MNLWRRFKAWRAERWRRQLGLCALALLTRPSDETERVGVRRYFDFCERKFRRWSR